MFKKGKWSPKKKPGRPKKAEVNAKRFAWAQKPKPSKNVFTINAKGQVTVSGTYSKGWSQTKANILAPMKQIGRPRKVHYKSTENMKNIPQKAQRMNLPLSTAQLMTQVDDTIPISAHAARELHERMVKIKGKAAEAEEYLKNGLLMPSSFIDALDYFGPAGGTGNVVAELSGKQYTFLNVPESIFNRWWEGKASCTTDDGNGTIRHMRWVQGKTPSLGAFFNQYIKNHYPYARGRFTL
jgi:hypothetical protein